jgi:hypothetical protein
MSEPAVVDVAAAPSQSVKVIEKLDTPGITMNQNGVISSKNEGKPGKKFHNGWTHELETLATEWADHASCYQWMHERSRQLQSNKNLRMKIPAIVLSTLTGTASFGLGSFFGEDSSSKTMAQMIIGSVSIIVGVIGTLDTFFQYAQSCEMHNTAAVNWGNFQRNIEFQMKLHPNERIDAMPFLKMMQNEMNRLIEQSPALLSCVLKEFQTKFEKNTDLKKPAVVNGLEHTTPHIDRDSRFVRVAEEVVHVIQQKKGLLKTLVLEELDQRVRQVTTAKVQELAGVPTERSPVSGESTPPTIVIRDV